jgi:hypothetical protein
MFKAALSTGFFLFAKRRSCICIFCQPVPRYFFLRLDQLDFRRSREAEPDKEETGLGKNAIHKNSISGAVTFRL